MLSEDELGGSGGPRSNLDTQTVLMHHKYGQNCCDGGGETTPNMQQQARRMITTPAIGLTRKVIHDETSVV